MAHEVPFFFLILHLVSPCGGLYDPVRRIESARLYGNIDAFAYYYVDLLVGTPPQRVSLIVDTGSGVTAFPCRSCRHCGSHIDPNFDFASSSTARWLPCGGSCPARCSSGHCQYHQGYTEGSSITGWYFQDMVRLGDAIQRNPPVKSVMGCHQDENRLFYTQKANGIMGVRPPGRGPPVILEQLWADDMHVDARVFAMCLAEWGGRLVVGGHNESYHKGPIQWTPLQTQGGYYNVRLQSIDVQGELVTGPFGTAMLDSGTTYTYMGRTPYRALRHAIEKYCVSHNRCNAHQRGTCYEAPDGLGGFPKLTMSLPGVKMRWPAKAYLYRKGSSNRWCYSFEDDGPGANTVLGASFMMHHEIIFDLIRTRVGVAEANCPEYKKRPTHDPNMDLSLPQAPSLRSRAQQAPPKKSAPAPGPAPAKMKAPAAVAARDVAPAAAPLEAPAAVAARDVAPAAAPLEVPVVATAEDVAPAAAPLEAHADEPAAAPAAQPSNELEGHRSPDPASNQLQLSAELTPLPGPSQGFGPVGLGVFVVGVIMSGVLGLTGGVCRGGKVGVADTRTATRDKPRHIGLETLEEESELDGEEDPLVASVEEDRRS